MRISRDTEWLIILSIAALLYKQLLSYTPRRPLRISSCVVKV